METNFLIDDKFNMNCIHCEHNILDIRMPFIICSHCNDVSCNSCVISFPHHNDEVLNVCLSCVCKINNKLKPICYKNEDDEIKKKKIVPDIIISAKIVTHNKVYDLLNSE